MQKVLRALPVFYSSHMVADAQSFSPSASKPRYVMESWRELGVPLDVQAPAPLARELLYRAHRSKYVDGVLDLAIDNGFGNRLPQVAESLRHTCGAMLAAARCAIANGRVAIAPCSGFHHARYGSGGGFCTLNGLMVAALELKAAGEVERIGILDFDQHYGDGTDDIIETLGIDWIEHFTAGAHYHTASQAGSFLRRIPRIVDSMRDCDVILYQAGADPHIDDPLGGWLTTDQLRERDRQVFAAAGALAVPVAWDLAGGYQSPLRKILDIHDNTLRESAACYLGSLAGPDDSVDEPSTRQACTQTT